MISPEIFSILLNLDPNPMKKKRLSSRLLVLVLFVYLLSCSKTTQVDDQKKSVPQQVNIDSLFRRENTNTIQYLGRSTFDCPEGPKYQDSLIYSNANSGNDYFVGPINNPGAGKYYSWPDGMVLDSLSGIINISKSETGLKYNIGFVKHGSKDTCLRTIILAGVSYVDSIYVLSKNQTHAYPYFNADLKINFICTGSDDDDDDNVNARCEFAVSNQKIKLGKVTGIIDLKRTFENGVFGSNPVNGTAIKASIYYRLNDKSNKVLQQMDVQLVYYETRAQVPKVVVDYIQQKSNDIMAQALIMAGGNPRPPMIVITRS